MSPCIKMCLETRKHRGKAAHPTLVLKVARNLVRDKWRWEGS